MTMTSKQTRENNMDSLDLRNNVQGGGSKRNRSTNNAKLPRKRMRPAITDPTECSDVSVEDRRTHADAGPPAKKSRSGVNATNTSNSIGIRGETKKRKASGDDKVPKKKMKWSKESSSSGSCVEMLSAESSDGMELSISAENRGGGNFSSDSSSMNTSRENNMHESCVILNADESNNANSSDSQNDVHMISLSSTSGEFNMLSVNEFSDGKQVSVSPDNGGGHFPSQEERIFEMSSMAKISRDDFEEKYHQGDPIGAGGFGSVYSGFRKSDYFPVAIKYIPSKDVMLERVTCNSKDFNIILEVALMLQTAGLPGSAGTSAAVSLLDWYCLDQMLILIMERPAHSRNLLEYLQSCEGSLDEQEVMMIQRQLVDAAVDMHAKGVFHRDIKLQNVLVTSDSCGPRVRIIDFGCGTFSTEDTYHSFCGTPAYFPPEWFDCGKYRAQSTTVWQLGALLFSLLEGHQSFTTEAFINNQIQINSARSADVKTLLHMCLTRDPEKRATLEMLQRHPALNYTIRPPTQGHS